MGDLEVRHPGLVERARRELDRRRAAQIAELGRQAALEMIAEGRTTLAYVEPINFTRARVQAGEWIADCPATGCKNAEYVTEKDPKRRHLAGSRGLPYRVFTCTYCGFRCDINWPADAEEITEVLDRRPMPHTRNWWPSGHPLAVVTGTPTGQSVADLLAENDLHGVE